jgi:hypothetical protein
MELTQLEDRRVLGRSRAHPRPSTLPQDDTLSRDPPSTPYLVPFRTPWLAVRAWPYDPGGEIGFVTPAFQGTDAILISFLALAISAVLAELTYPHPLPHAEIGA